MCSDWRSRKMDAEEAIEVLLVSHATGFCDTCSGTGVTNKDPNIRFVRDGEAVVFCKVCGGTGVLVNPIWEKAWLTLYPGDHAGVEERRREAVRKEWKGRKSVPNGRNRRGISQH